MNKLQPMGEHRWVRENQTEVMILDERSGQKQGIEQNLLCRWAIAS